MEKLLNLNVNKSPGPDLMHPHVVKELTAVLANPFYQIFQASIKVGKILTAWKEAIVTVIIRTRVINTIQKMIDQ